MTARSLYPSNLQGFQQSQLRKPKRGLSNGKFYGVLLLQIQEQRSAIQLVTEAHENRAYAQSDFGVLSTSLYGHQQRLHL